MQLDNQSPWQADLMPTWSLNKDRQHTLVVKVSYRFDLNVMARLTL